MNNKNSKENLSEIYFGERKINFKNVIINVLKIGNIQKSIIKYLTNDKNLEEYSKCFTSKFADSVNNYEMYELVGDSIAGAIIKTYMLERFPQLNCCDGVKVVARLLIKYGSKESFFPISESLSFWNFITAPTELRFCKKKSLLEDVFEAFIGCTVTLLDQWSSNIQKKTNSNYYKKGVGFGVSYRILSKLFDKINISLKYNDLFDSKTRLKELFDIHSKSLGKLLYENNKVEIRSNNTINRTIYSSHCSIYCIPLQESSFAAKIENQYEKLTKEQLIRLLINPKSITKKQDKSKWVLLGKSTGSLKSIAQQNAAKNALLYLKNQGYYRDPPKEYSKFLIEEK